MSRSRKSKKSAGRKAGDSQDLHDPRTEGVDLPAQLEDETSKAYSAFVMYAQTDPLDRSCERVARMLDRSGRWIREWSRRHDWVARAERFDVAVAAERRRRWHAARDQVDLELLRAELGTQREAKRQLLETATTRLTQIIAESDNEHAVVQAVGKLIKLADHKPDRPRVPDHVVEDPGHVGVADAIRALIDAGADSSLLVQLARSLPDDDDTDQDDDDG